MSNDQRRALLTTFLVILTGSAPLTGLVLVVSNPISAQGTFQNQRDPSACDAIGNNGTNCQDAFSSDNIYASTSGWFHADWRFRKKFTINSTKVTADLTNFPVLINITDTDLRDDAQNDGDDILFTTDDGTTKLNHEIEEFNGTAGELVAWVNVTSLSPSANTAIFMYYGNSTATNQENPTGVWDVNFRGVYHIREDPTDSAPQVLDSTSNNRDLTAFDPWDSSDQVDGQIDGSLDFQVGNKRLEHTLPGDETQDFTLSQWVRAPSSPAEYKAAFASTQGAQANSFQLDVGGPAQGCDGNYRFRGRDSSSVNFAVCLSVRSQEWEYLTVTWDGTTVRTYQNGTLQNTATPMFTGLFQIYRLGMNRNNNTPFEGMIDETRISNVARSADWIATEYNNQDDTSTFYRVGVEERPTSDTVWKNFGFNLNATDTIERVEIGVEWYRDNAAPSLNATTSWDGGTTWAANRTATNRSTDDNALQFLDFTSVASWTPSMLSDANLRARAGTNGSGAHLDHIAVRVTFTTASLPGGLDGAPVVVTLAARDVTQDTASLRGNMGDLGDAASVQVSFEWGLSPALGSETTPQALQTPAIFQATLEKLDGGTTFYFRAKAVGNGTAVGETLTFQTGPPALAGDLFSQLWPWLVLAAIAAVVGYLLTRRQLATRRKLGRPSEAAQNPPGAGEVRGGLFAKIGGVVVASKGASSAPAANLGGVAGGPMLSEILCPHCGTQLEGGAVYCYNCRGLAEGTDPEERVERGMEAQAEDEPNRDAPFTVGPQLPAAGGTCPYCGTTLEPETGNCPECARSVLDRGEALEEKVRRALAILDVDENDKDALFTLGTYLLLDGKAQEALDTLNRLTLLDPEYPGLWRVKALIFEKMGKKEAAEWARERA